MAVQTFTSLPELQEILFGLTPEKQVFSFDVFDTLLVRRIHDPDLVKEPVSRFLTRRAEENGRPVRINRVRAERGRIEAAMRQRNLRLHGDAEAVFPDLIRAWTEAFLPEEQVDAVAEEVEELEIDLEKRVLVPRRGWRKLLGHLKEKGKTLLAVSDMYLPSARIAELLDDAGFDGLFDRVVSSADRIQSKASGAGFRQLVKDHGFSTGEWVHVGDNPFSDGLVPDSMGILALNLRDVRERKRHSLLQRYHRASGSKKFWAGRYVLQAALPLESETGAEGPCSALYQEGVTTFGPLLCGFMAYLAEESRTAQIPVLYFLSREGWMFREVWNRMAPVLALEGPLPEVRYLHVSRKSLAGACCGARGLTQELVEFLLLPMENRDLRDIFRVIGIDPESVRTYLQRYGLQDHPPISLHHQGFHLDTWMSLLDLLHDVEFQAEVKRRKASEIEGLRSYLRDIGYFEQSDVGFVDVGWLGSIQRLFDLCVSDVEDRPVLHGYLLAASRRRPFVSHAKSRLTGWLYDGRKGDVYAGSMLLYQELFEEICRPDLPGLLRYDQNVEGCRVFRSETDPSFLKEKEQTREIVPLQQGMLDMAERVAVVLAVSTVPASNLKAWLAQSLTVKIAFPRASEVVRLRHHHHMNDLGREEAPLQQHLRRKPPSRLWDLSRGALRWIPGLRLWHYLKHQLFEMVIVHER